MDGRPWTEFNAVKRTVAVPTGQGHAVQVTFIPGVPAPKNPN